MGAEVEVLPVAVCAAPTVEFQDPPCGSGASRDIRVRHATLHGIEVPVDCVADMIDEFPILCIAAACARGRPVIRGAAELRVQQSDRLAAMAEGLRALGIVVEEAPDGRAIAGGRLRGERKSGVRGKRVY